MCEVSMSGFCTCIRGSTTTAFRELYGGRETRSHQDGTLAGGKVFRLGCVHYSDTDPSFFIFRTASALHRLSQKQSTPAGGSISVSGEVNTGGWVKSQVKWQQKQPISHIGGSFVNKCPPFVNKHILMPQVGKRKL